jgi:hypothetical protein
MTLAFAPWLILAIAVATQATGVLGTVGSAITGVDNAITATLDLKRLFTPLVIQPIKPVVIPPAKKKKVASK